MAISEQSYARGNPVYGSGSSAPTRGTVDPTGYVDRSLNAPSQKRSGLAQAALERLQGVGNSDSSIGGGYSAGTSNSQGVLPLGDVKTLSISPTGQMIPDNGIVNPIVPEQSTTQQPQSPLAMAALSRLMAQGGMDGSAPSPTI